MEFSTEHCKKSLDFARAGDDASSGKSRNSDLGSLSRKSTLMIML